MRLVHVSLGGLRVFAEAFFCPGPGLSWLVGSNGAGKTTVLEALFGLTHARSFRTAQFESVLRSGEGRGFVFSEWMDRDGVPLRMAGGRARGGGWEYRVDGVPVGRVSDLAVRAPMLCFEPGSHLLVSGPAERRRRLLDWGVFHVERAPPSLWSDWQRALRQRNELLRTGDIPQLEAFDIVLCAVSESLHRARQNLSARWLERSLGVLRWLSPDLADTQLEYRRGWGRAHASLSDALKANLSRDLAVSYTGSGPHRADIAIRVDGVDARERLSRGQSKVLALSLVLGMGNLYREAHGVLPLLLLDDLCSELDETHSKSVLAYLRDHEAQALITGVQRPVWAETPEEPLFHVEQGTITPLL